MGILAVTLTPLGNKPPELFSPCIACGPRGLADGILNLCLFIPLGLAIGWDHPRLIAFILSGFLLSTGIELVQTIVPGRDPSLSDIIFNTLGTAIGATIARRPRVWLRPNRHTAIILSAASLGCAATIMLATAFLLSPSDSSSLVGRSGNDIVLRFTTRASSVGLDEPQYRLAGAARAPAIAAPAISVRRDRSRWQIRTGEGDTVMLGPTVGQGWALLAYPDAIALRWGPVLDTVWMAALFVAVGFWARGRLLAFAAAGASLLLVLVPLVAGIVGTTKEEWAGAGIGLGSGAMLWILWRRSDALSLSQQSSE